MIQTLPPCKVNEVKKLNLQQLKKEYEGEWLALKIIREDEGEIRDCELIAHSTVKPSLHEELRAKKVKDAYITFAGELKPEYAVIFYGI